MTFRKGGAGKRRDAIEADTIALLEAHGMQVWQISGRGLPDVLIYYRRRFFVLELKSGKAGRLTRAQALIAWPVARSADQALALILGAGGGDEL